MIDSKKRTKPHARLQDIDFILRIAAEPEEGAAQVGETVKVSDRRGNHNVRPGEHLQPGNRVSRAVEKYVTERAYDRPRFVSSEPDFTGS